MKKIILSLLTFTLFATIAFGQEAEEQDHHEFELRVFELTNSERERRNLPPFIWDDTLAAAARLHSEDMMRSNRMSHRGSDGSSFSLRVRRAGINNMANGAENVAAGQVTPEQVVASWMNSSGHRANILSRNTTHLGVGFVWRAEGSNARYETYWTQVFCSFM